MVLQINAYDCCHLNSSDSMVKAFAWLAFSRLIYGSVGDRYQIDKPKYLIKTEFPLLYSFLSYPVFEGIVRKQIQKINAPAKECLKNVNLIVEQITSAAIDKTLVRFQPLQMEVHKLMNHERKKAEKNANDALATIFAMENLVFTQDGNFAGLMEGIEGEDKKEAAKNAQAASHAGIQ